MTMIEIVLVYRCIGTVAVQLFCKKDGKKIAKWRKDF